MQAVLSQLVAVGAEAPERAGGVVAAEGALLPLRLQTLVDVFAHLHWTGHVAVGALTLKSTHGVGASAVSTDVA